MTAFKRSALACALTVGLALPASAQLGHQHGLIEPNVAADTAISKLPYITASLAAKLKEARPILSATTLDSILASSGVTKAQRTELYGKMFVHVDLNRGTDAELLLIPGFDAKMVAAAKAGRPFKTFADFEKAMAKHGTPAEIGHIEQYLFIPIDLNTFTDPLMDTFASIGVGTKKWKHEFAEYRPWKSMEQFRKDIGKYVRGNPNELDRLQRYVIINK